MTVMDEVEFTRDRPKDPVYIVSGRLSHAVRVGAAPEVIKELQQELAVAQVVKYLGIKFESTPPTQAQAKSLCKIIMAVARAA